ncbi:MAG: hypothetical protein CMJ65_14255 [Planctomycetaceae bacterium]|nr:hypothetical protein [Planctomycetaceae bacterium]
MGRYGDWRLVVPDAGNAPLFLRRSGLAEPDRGFGFDPESEGVGVDARSAVRYSGTFPRLLTLQ